MTAAGGSKSLQSGKSWQRKQLHELSTTDGRTTMAKSIESTGSKIIVGVVIAVVAAAVGYLISYLDQHRRDQITFVSAQIEKLYGPLFALAKANDIAWRHFQEADWDDRPVYFPDGVALPEKDIVVWRLWMSNVFQPMNVKMENAIVNNAQLLVGEEMPQMFLQFISHTEAYKSVIATWKEGAPIVEADRLSRANASPVSFPKQPDFTDCIVDQYHMLKALQQQLQEQVVRWFTALREEIAPACLKK
jgi:hypothetical protein